MSQKKGKFQRLLNKLSKTIAFAKKSYFSKILEKSKHNVRKTWQILQSLLTATIKNFSAKIINEQNDPKRQLILEILFFALLEKSFLIKSSKMKTTPF